MAGQQVVPAAVVQPVGVLALTVQRVRGHHHPAQVGQGGQGGSEGSDLITVDHADLRQHQPVAVLVDRDQLGLGAVGPAGAARATARRPSTQPVNTASAALTSTADSTRRNVGSDGGRPPGRISVWAAAAHSAIAAYEWAPAITAPNASSNTDYRLCRRPRRCQWSGTAPNAWISVLDSTADSYPDGSSARWATDNNDGEDELAGTGLLTGDLRLRHPKTTTRPVPALKPASQPHRSRQ